ncbi:MAG: hypothetical protein ACI86M_002246 [Saprospiraceae bacterium]|jgi:hypothetical protein
MSRSQQFKKYLNAFLFSKVRSFNFVILYLMVTSLYPDSAFSQSYNDEDPYYIANMTFRGFFSEARAKLVEEQGPFVLLIGDNLILHHDNKRDTQRVVMPLYHDLKVVAHIPFGVYVCLLYEPDGPLSPEKEQQLISFKKLTEEVLRLVPSRSFPSDFISIQEDLLNQSIAFMDKVLQSKIVNRTNLISFMRRNRDNIDLNTDKTAQVQLDVMLEVMNNWFSKMTEEEQMGTRAIISGRKCCRTKALETQFFSKFLRESGEGGRVFFTEAIFEPERMLSTFGTYLISQHAGEDIYQNPHRMHEDLLAQFAEKYLLKMKF